MLAAYILVSLPIALTPRPLRPVAICVTAHVLAHLQRKLAPQTLEPRP